VARLTPLSIDEARQLLARFGLDLKQLTALEAGSVNSNFRLETEQGVFFARIYEEQSHAGALAEMQVIRELAECGVPTPVPLRPLAGEEPLTSSGKPFAVYPWVAGEILCQRRTTAAHLRQVGSALGCLHRASDRLSQIPDGRFEPTHLEQRFSEIEQRIGGNSELEGALQLIQSRLGHYVRTRSASLPRGVIHGDLFRDNALWKDDQLVALIDFESASRGTFAYDIMVCIHAWCFGDRFELDKVRAFFDGYGQERRLTSLEGDSLVAEGAIAALRFATTRITDFSLRAAPGTAPKRDYRRFLQRLEQIEAGVLEPVLRQFRSTTH